jgi:hypothetical protein
MSPITATPMIRKDKLAIAKNTFMTVITEPYCWGDAAQNQYIDNNVVKTYRKNDR